jgi:folate-dependent phosphoribosylglycinamide formyltransferase PurN
MMAAEDEATAVDGRPSVEHARVVVFTSGPSLEAAARDFIVRLEAHPELAVVGVFHESSGTGLRDVILDAWRRRGPLAIPVLALHFARVLARFVRPLGERRSRRAMATLAGRVFDVPDTHADDVLEKIRELEPDLGVIYGGPILKASVFEIPRFGTLGIHHGKLPEYRGKKTTFWAMYNGEASAGVTIQRVNAGLDTGEVVRAGEVRIGRLPLGLVWRRLERVGISLFVEAVLEVKRGRATLAKPEGEKGRLYRDPGPGEILTFWRRYLVRLVRQPDSGRVA